MNMQSIMAQAQKMQRDIAKKKEEIEKTIYEGASEWIKVQINGKKEIIKLNITYTESIDAEDKEILEDMLKIALNDAYQKLDKDLEDKMGSYGNLGGLF